ncbi:MAG: glycine--tRNA ligase subunit beta [Burkholderiales bacterium]|nr:glycine--tRNA ligase subunit beta [Burkholderiales bacterium]
MPPEAATALPKAAHPQTTGAAAAVAPLLVELFTEELPPKALRRLGEAFAAGVAEGLRSRGLAEADARVEAFATPRRLAVRVDPVAARAPDRSIEVKGPSLKVGLDAEGRPTQALLKWAERQGAGIDALTRASDGKQECFWFRSTARGEALDASIPALLEQALSRLPIPKVMQYQLADGRTTVSFVRPVHGLVVLHGARVVEASILGLPAGRTTRGHRFQSDGTIELADARAYEGALESRGRVVAAFETRRARIEALLRERAAALGASLGDEEPVMALLDEVAALVEWPAVYAGEFDREFLQVPQECLILTMRTNQKYFPLFQADGRLLPKFLIVSNMAVDDPRLIIAGNERVVRPRLADARFFFEQDKKTRLADRVGQLGSVVYHARLGTQGERVERVREIARAVATLLGADAALADRAALLAKTDLLTGMVGEFPELQGIMGTYYARHDGEPEAVARAIAEHYQPRHAGDALPASETGTVLALADKLETLAGMFGIGQQPTGDKDPFALRRHALGVIRMLIERRLELPLNALVDAAFRAFGDRVSHAHAELETFFHERLAGYLRERGYTAQEIAAVVDQRPMQLARVPAQLEAVREFSRLPEAEALAAANKRIVNILRKAGDGIGSAVDRALLAEPAERALADQVARLAPQLEARMQAADFTGAMTLMAQARDDVDRFFDQVLVMADDERVRANRLALLSGLRHLMNRVADISKLSR